MVNNRVSKKSTIIHMGGGGSQKYPKNDPHGLQMTPKHAPGPPIMFNVRIATIILVYSFHKNMVWCRCCQIGNTFNFPEMFQATAAFKDTSCKKKCFSTAVQVSKYQSTQVTTQHYITSLLKSNTEMSSFCVVQYQSTLPTYLMWWNVEDQTTSFL